MSSGSYKNSTYKNKKFKKQLYFSMLIDCEIKSTPKRVALGCLHKGPT